MAVTLVAPGLYRTAMPQALLSFTVADGSPYAAAFSALQRVNAARLLAAGDPDEAARVNEDCLRAADPPARLVAGDDAAGMDQAVRQAGAEGLARLLREFVAGLAS